MEREGEGQTALITGASGGIGLELARCFARGGYKLVLVARSAEALDKAAAGFTSEFGVSAVPIAHDRPAGCPRGACSNFEGARPRYRCPRQ